MPSLIAFLAPVEKLSLNRAAADKLRQGIVSGAVAPGARLTEIALAGRMGLSRGTIRAALQGLVAEGLIVQRPYIGWEVVSLTSRDAWELYTLRGALEALAARLAAETMNAQKRRVLEETFGRLKAAANADDPTAITDADLALHKTIVSMSGHRRLMDQYAVVEQQVRMYIASTNARLRERQLVVQEHKPLVQAVAKGDGDAAERRAREHCAYAGDDLVAHLEQQERERADQQDALATASADAG
ncbi:MAG: GntR family transcriptional regulator [Casimicrobiaceae bacterium]